MESVSVIIPAYNEEACLARVVTELRDVLNKASIDHEILVVVDGATDGTEMVARQVADSVAVHPINMGYGRSLKTGIARAKHDLIVITDADGTYPVARIPELVTLADRFDMVVGARTGKFYQGSSVKRVGRIVFRLLSEFATGQKIPDINSGLRVFRRSQILQFFPLISSGFSFTTTSTLVYLLNGMFVRYMPIEYFEREGNSKVRHVRDSLRALQIIIEAILRCNPIKAFLLLAVPVMLCALLFFITALIMLSSIAMLCSVILFGTSLILVALGFVAVSLLPIRSVAVVDPNHKLHEKASE
jgi:glycosyltransferase involved in cell wall biosynthesis